MKDTSNGAFCCVLQVPNLSLTEQGSVVSCEISLPKGTVVTHIRQSRRDAVAVLSPV